MTREWLLRLFCGLVGGAVGAVLEGVPWTWWAAWVVALGSCLLVGWWRRDEFVHA